MLYFCVFLGGGAIFLLCLAITFFSNAIENNEPEHLPLAILSLIGMFCLLGIMLMC